MARRREMFNKDNLNFTELKKNINEYILDIYDLDKQFRNSEIDDLFFNNELNFLTKRFWTYFDKEYLNFKSL